MAASNGRNVMVQGRLVWVSGDLFKGRVKTEFGTQTPKLNKAGEVQMEYGFGLAIPKSVLGQMGAGQPGEIWAAMHEEAYTLYPSRQIPPAFAMKYKDGDGIDDKGVPFSQRPGYAGHIVLSCTTTLPIKFFRYENGQNFQISEGIKCGDYVNVQLNVKAHPAIGAGKPGLYINPNAVQFLGYGEAIVNTPSGDSVFGNQAPPLPPGASATPLAPSGFIQPPSQGFAPPAAPQGYAQPQAPVAAPQPHYGVLPPAHQPMPEQQPQMPQAPAMPQQQWQPPQQPMMPPGFPPFNGNGQQ